MYRVVCVYRAYHCQYSKRSQDYSPDGLAAFKLEMTHRRLVYSPASCIKNHNTWRTLPETPCSCTEFSWFWMPRVSETTRWRNLVPGSLCRATQELSNSGWTMGIRWSESRCPTSCARYFFEWLQIACTKLFTAELMDVSGLWDLNKKRVEELFYLLVFVWISRSEVWPK